MQSCCLQYADYFIAFDGQWVPVETKIDINVEVNIDHQVSKYCDLTEVVLNPKEGEAAALEDLVQNRVLIIDERRIQMYDHENNTRTNIAELADIKTKKDVQSLRNRISEML